MPGLSFILDFNKDLRNEINDISMSLDSMIHYEHYSKNIILKEEKYVLSCTSYPEYPLRTFENEHYQVLLEGQIYGKDDTFLKKELIGLAENIFQSKHFNNKQISEWILKNDGEFIIFILNKDLQEIIILNDPIGHLPLYYFNKNNRLLVSRELRFITNLTSESRFDRMAIAQYLLLGYTLGKKTLLENIFRVRPATMIKININECLIKFINIYHFNFENKKYKDKTIDENANNLTQIFDEACSIRAESRKDYTNVLSLSGGLDSRAVGGAMHRNNIKFAGMTIFNRKNIKDVDIAQQIAKVFTIDWDLVEILNCKGKDYLKLLRIKNGLNYLGMSNIFYFFNKIKEKYGSKVNLLTGDGGDRSITCFSPYKKLRNLNDLVNYIISTNQIFSLDNVSTLTKIPKNQIIEEIKKHVDRYPEKDVNHKYVHFMVYENAINWVNEGVDRNRFYFWVLTPLWSIHLFKYAMNCPDQQKKYYKLYRKFIYNLSSQAAAIDYANYGAAPQSMKLTLKLFLISKSPRKLKEFIKKIFSNKINLINHNAGIMKCFSEQLRNCIAIEKYLSYPEIESIVNKSTMHQFETLFTLTSSIDEFECNKNIIGNYLDTDFR